ncbi:ATP-binding protein [Streptomyces sp. TRM70308]|uniref:ATP-binding protein n=1 Tax=Streptomyces sp. TRM70308 TaxID=3131932 RepID=UPI003CFDA126
MSTDRIWELLLPGIPEEVSRARRWTREVLSACACADDAALIVTELAANAVTHTASPAFRVTICRTDEAVTLAVTDTGHTATTRPHVTHADDASTHGRGLHIAATLATDLTVTRHDYGHTVTARLPGLPLAGIVNEQARTC